VRHHQASGLCFALLALAADPAAAQQPAAAAAGDAALASWVDGQLDGLEQLYRWLHQNPELSFHEKATAARLADELEAAGVTVTRGFGGHGIVGLLKNGDGPVGMVRADMDALPIAEQTGLPYAAPVLGTSADGQPVGRMHACGHDVHMTCLVGTARWFAAHRDAWSGTLLLIGQPAEERAGGAKAMLAAGLLEKFPRPDWALALHTASDLATDRVGLRSGYAMANVDSCDVTMFGRGGHGAAPHLCVDPIVQAAQLVLDLQTIVAREVDPIEAAVITVGAIQGGSKHNVIDDRCHLQITLRSYTPAVREHLKAAIVRKAEAIARGARAPDPVVEFSEPTAALRNDDALTERVRAAIGGVLGADAVVDVPPAMAAEDFGQFGAAGIPICMFRLGTIAPARLAELQAAGGPPALHSSRYRPDARPAIATGLRAMVGAVRSLLRSGTARR
jgi:hippurate hydrolase